MTIYTGAGPRRGTLQFPYATALGLHWVRDLVMQCDLTVEKPQGSAVLELVAGGVPFRCRIDLATGRATLSMARSGAKYVFDDEKGHTARELSQPTAVKGPGTYRLRLANIDEQLHLWVDGKLVTFPLPATYHALDNVVPQTDAEGGLDLAPVGIGSEGAAMKVAHMRLWRDLYYIAVKEGHIRGVGDFLPDDLPRRLRESVPTPREPINPDFEVRRAEFLSTPSYWDRAFAEMNSESFPLARKPNPQKDQFLMLGDNSPESSDGRLWDAPAPGMPSPPSGREYYVKRELLIGKALLTYWPLSQWGWVR